MRRWIVLTFVVVSFLLLLPFGFQNKLLQQEPAIQIVMYDLRPGDYFTLLVRNAIEGDVVQVVSRALKEPPQFYQEGKDLIALVPIEYRTKPGTYPLTVTIERANRIITTFEESVTIHYREFSEQRLTVSPELQAKRADPLWDEDTVHTTKARSQTSLYPLWEGPFLQPVQGRISTEFGQIRYINDIDSGRHSGLDIAAATGTPIVASNTGLITLARNLHVTGNTVMIDHGRNLFTSYCHLDRVLVQDGQLVKKGDVIGTVGNTGFSTGPHLHWSVSIGSVFINPQLVMDREP